MKTKYLCMGVFFSIALTPAVLAKQLARINIQLTATIIDSSCTVAFGDDDKTVSLGSWDPAYFRRPGIESLAVPFTLHLTECPPGSVAITFTGKSPAGFPDLLALTESDDSAQNVAVKILDREKKPLPLGSASPQVDVDPNGNAPMQFYANYIAVANNVVGGTAHADATFTVTYY